MQSLSAPASIELEVGRIRELSRSGRHAEALAAAELLAATAPEDRGVLYLMAANQRCLKQIPEALATLQRLERGHPRYSLLYQERGHCYLTLRNASRAIEAFRQAVEINPALAESWAMLERLYRITGELKLPEVAAGHVTALLKLPPEIVRAGILFSDGELSGAENLLRTHLRHSGEDVEALRLLGRIEHQRDRLAEAESLLAAALKLAPAYSAARFDYARVLVDRQKYAPACEELQALVTLEPGYSGYLSLYAAAWAGLGNYERAIELYRELLATLPHSAELHVSLGHALQAVGRQKEAIEAYRQAAALRPSFGDAWWSLANLKIYEFPEEELARMRAGEASPATGDVDRYHLCFALGKALEDRGEYQESWRFYERGNGLKRAGSRYDPDLIEGEMRRQIEVCTAQLFAARSGAGAPDPDPIFVVGLPRSGSTLIEQILASHSQVEGTQELAEVQRIVLGIGDTPAGDTDRRLPAVADDRYPGVLAELAAEDFRRLGELYLAGTRPYRHQKPFFIDKMPNNFRHIGLIHLMLPQATIIDVRREPMACCFSNFKQLFARGQEFTYSMEHLARYYRTYLELMRHWDAVLPGRILRVWYEDVVEDLGGTVRRMLEFCGLEFEAACVEFYHTQRSVRTASSEQVRQPIFRRGLSHWKNYEAWLDSLNESLGDAATRYRPEA